MNITKLDNINYLEVEMENENKIEEKMKSDIIRFIKQVNFGEVIITIHNSKIVQIERREKKRYSK